MTSHGTVVTYAPGDPDFHRSYESCTHVAVGRAIAELEGYDFGGEYDPARRYPGPIYFVPREALVGRDAARRLGVHTADDLFGGVVPHAFVATKAIVHPLVGPDALAPEGWSHAFARRIAEVALPGYTAFTLRDAFVAGERLLLHGRVRIKDPLAAGCRGQTVVATDVELAAALASVEPRRLAGCGLVLERDLAQTQTFSVGQVRVAGLTASYYGVQRTTVDNDGRVAYGGSDLLVVRGDFDALLGLGLPREVLLAVAQALTFDAATAEYPDVVLSRRNYDVVQGYDEHGRWHSGVLEQSWRVGGASGPELAALLAFRADPGLRAVRASSVERFGPGLAPPARSLVHYRGTDARRGPMLKYTTVATDVSHA